MSEHHPLYGVYAAALTPLSENGDNDLEEIVTLLDFLAQRGCHGALLHGTTGEGPSFAPDERVALWEAALVVKQKWPEFRLLAGTGTPSLTESADLTHKAFDLGFDGVLVLPPYYYRKAEDAGLFSWFSQLIQTAVPSDGILLGYHIPGTSGVGLSLDLLARLKDAYPDQFAGIKDSSSSPTHMTALGERFGKDLLVFNGNDRLFRMALENHAAGCITAMANVISPQLRCVWDEFLGGRVNSHAQAQLNAAREIFEAYPPAPPMLKLLLSHFFGFQRWAVRPPLMPFELPTEETILTDVFAKLELP